MTGPDRTPPEPGPDAGVEDIQADIERTREELGETVGALTAKLDVKARAKEQAAETKDRLAAKSRETRDVLLDKVTDERGSVKPSLPVIAIAAATAIGVIVWIRRR